MKRNLERVRSGLTSESCEAFLQLKLLEDLEDKDFEGVIQFANAMALIQESENEGVPRAADGLATYWLSSELIKKAYSECIRDRREAVVVLSGFCTDRIHVPSVMHVPEHKSRSFAGATVSAMAIHRIVVEGARNGHVPQIVLHSHPGKGRDANRSSDVDRNTQAGWEEIGPVIGGIFSRDGWVRFFSKSLDFQVEVHGKGVEQYGDNEFYLQM